MALEDDESGLDREGNQDGYQDPNVMTDSLAPPESYGSQSERFLGSGCMSVPHGHPPLNLQFIIFILTYLLLILNQKKAKFI
jgi:hypothetical protein